MKGKLFSPLIFLSILSVHPWAIAHGVKITYQVTPALEIQAAYDNGEPMAHAQVSVYAPNNPSALWLSGTTDAAGRFIFMPNIALGRDWEIQVRQAGHGNIVTVPLGESFATADTTAKTLSVLSGDSNYTPPQLFLMGAIGIWGFVGTALFFSRRRG